MTRKKKLIIGGVVLLLVAAAAAAYFYFRREKGVQVNVEATKARDLEAIVTASGKIQPKRFVNISADTMGRVTELAVDEGMRVKQGEFLLQIDPRNLQSALHRGEAGVAAAESQLRQLRAGVTSSTEQLALARENLKRQRELWKEGLTTREALDQAENEVKVREADLHASQQQIATQAARIRQERAALSSARYDLSKVRIESPIDGIITRRNIEEGETVVVGTMNNAGTVLLTVADMSVIEAEVEVDETDLPSVKLGQPAEIKIDALPDRVFTGKVTEIGNSPIQTTTGQAAAGQQATNFKVVVTIDEAIPEVRPGFTCSAEITTATRDDVLSVPIQAMAVREVVYDAQGNIVREPRERKGAGTGVAQAVSAAELKPGQTRKEEEGVFVVRDGVAQFVPVKTGIAGDKYFEVLKGLEPGTQVITGPFNSVRSLKDGDEVRIAPGPGDRPGDRSRS